MEADHALNRMEAWRQRAPIQEVSDAASRVPPESRAHPGPRRRYGPGAHPRRRHPAGPLSPPRLRRVGERARHPHPARRPRRPRAPHEDAGCRAGRGGHAMSRARRMRLLALVVLLASALRTANVATPAAGGAAGGKVVIRFSHNQPTPRIQHQAVVLFKQLVEERTQGYYDVQIFPAMQLGSARDQVEQTMLGVLDITQQATATVSLFVP